jgi:hypothetical protein
MGIAAWVSHEKSRACRRVDRHSLPSYQIDPVRAVRAFDDTRVSGLPTPESRISKVIGSFSGATVSLDRSLDSAQRPAVLSSNGALFVNHESGPFFNCQGNWGTGNVLRWW